jgi:hypothetical protein
MSEQPTKTWIIQRWSRWAMTPTGRQCLCYLSLKIAKMRAVYLRGRLQAAFRAGVEAGIEFERQRQRENLFSGRES